MSLKSSKSVDMIRGHTNDGTSEVFELEEVLSNDGHAQLEIYKDEPVREENPKG
jgi:hypothetical protein